MKLHWKGDKINLEVSIIPTNRKHSFNRDQGPGTSTNFFPLTVRIRNIYEKRCEHFLSDQNHRKGQKVIWILIKKEEIRANSNVAIWKISMSIKEAQGARAAAWRSGQFTEFEMELEKQ